MRADDGRTGPPQNLSPSFAVPSMRDADFASFQGISVPAPLRRLVESLPFKVVLYALKSDNKNRRFAAVLSPLPDSNRGPPPYHGGFALREGD